MDEGLEMRERSEVDEGRKISMRVFSAHIKFAWELMRAHSLVRG